MIAECVDESGQPAVLIRADRRMTIISMKMGPGDEGPTQTETYNDDVNKTVIVSNGVGVAFAGEPEMGYLAVDVIRHFANQLEKDGITQELGQKIGASLALAASQMGASGEGLTHSADLLVGVRANDGRVSMFRAVAITPGVLSMSGDGYNPAPRVSMQIVKAPTAIGLDVTEPNIVLHKTLHEWFGDPRMGENTAGHSMDVVGAFLENAFDYELEHNPDAQYINDRATYLLVSKDGTRQLSDAEVMRFRELNERIVNSRLSPRHAVAQIELSEATAKKRVSDAEASPQSGQTSDRTKTTA